MSSDTITSPPASPNGNLWKYALIAVLIIVLAVTNPSLQSHRDAVKDKVGKLIEKELGAGQNNTGLSSQLGAMMSETMVNGIVNQIVFRKEYYLFSLTTVKYSDQEETIGLGILGHVFINDKIDEKFNEAKGKLNFDIK